MKTAEQERKKAEKEYEEKLAKEKAKMEKERAAYYNQPQQMNAVHYPTAASYQQPAPAGVHYAAQMDPFGPPAYPPPPPVAAPVLPQAKVLMNYDARSPAECSIRVGETVVVLQDAPSGWTEVSSPTGARGWAPSSYLQKLTK